MNKTELEIIGKHLGEKLRELRKAHGQNQQQLGEVLGGVSYQQVQKWETGINRLSASRLYAAAQHYKKDVSWFFLGLSQPKGTQEMLEALKVRLDNASPEKLEAINILLQP